ncbi:hypothetical protein [Staphylococcus sp. Ze7]|uniref:hypothetical protein n=1 Tax=unclassified Staphylococcus TaxID=91994 RepID=UPI003AAC2F84
MNTKAFSQSQMLEIQRHLKSGNIQPCCNQPKFEILSDVFTLNVSSDSLPAPHMELATVICKNCAQTKLYAVKNLIKTNI